VSTDQGLDQDFNSLDAQYDASQAYIRSQAHAGWTMLRSKYDDGGFSGGNTDRPALQRLLDDIRAGKIDIIVVYKVDRLTRSLADFAKLVELFDQHGVSFVSVTQQFNTTTSMGRLTLNVLLSFAQFEREVTSERIRDKIGASKRKGLWVGGRAPFGYESKDRKIRVVDKDAEAVRTIFQLYLQTGSIYRLMTELHERGIVSKVQRLKSGKTVGGVPFTSGPLSYLLRNRFYIGEVVYKGEVLGGEQEPIIDRATFEAVQEKLAEQKNNTIETRSKSEAILTGLIFDDRGNRMSPSHARKGGVRYRYYTSLALLQGRRHEGGSVDRVPATDIETTVVNAVLQHLGLGPTAEPGELIRTSIDRLTVHPERLVIILKASGASTDDHRKQGESIEVRWVKPPAKRRRELLHAHRATATMARPIRSDARRRLVTAIARARLWVSELTADASLDTAQIALREGCTVRQINKIISLAFLAPDLVQAALHGRLPRGTGLARLCDLPAEWSLQRQQIGLGEQ
jgi:DNA invertase Pin-like site-specific DNA recombinase